MCLGPGMEVEVEGTIFWELRKVIGKNVEDLGRKVGRKSDPNDGGREPTFMLFLFMLLSLRL